MTTNDIRPASLLIIRLLLATFLLLTSLNRFTATDANYFSGQLSEIGLPDLPGLSIVVGIIQLLAFAAVLIPNYRLSQVILYIYGVLALAPMAMLFTHPVWIDSLGGFPAIGAGQGLIKYLAISGVSLFIASHYHGKDRLNRFAFGLVWLGIILVMGWIGAMKFTQFEADAIERLMRSSPLFSWIYEYMTVLQGSYFIGAVEWIAVLGIVIGLIFNNNRALFFNLIGLMVAAATFIATQTFIVTLPAYDVSSGFPMLNGSGQFIVKDLVLLAGTLLLFTRLKRA